MQEQVENNQIAFHLVYHVLVFVVEILAALLLVAGITHCCQASYQFFYEVFGSVSMEDKPGADRDFKVEKSESVYHMAGRLEDAGLIRSKYSFYVRVFLTEQNRGVFHAGTYTLNTSMDYEDIINVLTMNE